MAIPIQHQELLQFLTPQYSYSSEAICNVMHIAFGGALTAQSPLIPQPEAIKVPLKPHQRAVIHAMMEHEKQSMKGIQFHNSTTFMNYGILGDEVGSGKSLAVLGFLAHRKQTPIELTKNALYHYSRNNLFTMYSSPATSDGPALIIVPHTIYRQWQDYCKQQTTLKVFFAKSHKELSPHYTTPDVSGHQAIKETFATTLKGSDIVLVSNTLYSSLQTIARDLDLKWSRIFVDEADSVHLTGGCPPPEAPFVWFITATWPNILLNGHYLRPSLLDHYMNHQQRYCPALGEWLRNELGIQSVNPSNYYGHTTWMKCRSTNWLREYFSDHVFRGMAAIFCSKPFLKESQQMPPQIEEIFWCEQPATQRAVMKLVSPDLQQMLHAGNIEGALEKLGVNADTSVNLIEAVTKEREKELKKQQNILAFKETQEYSTPQIKEDSINKTKAKIASIEMQLKTFKERLSDTAQEDCPICYENPRDTQAMLTPCCHRIFCGSCVLRSLARRTDCPLCRTPIQPTQLVHLVAEKPKKNKKEKKEEKLLSKPKRLLKFLKENPEARVLVFSRYENPFIALEKDCEDAGISYHTLRGNKDAIANTVKQFEKGEKRVLFLPTQTAGAGLNLVSATHVVLLHAMTPEEEKQVIGRAYRLGRSKELKIIKLLHEGETISS